MRWPILLAALVLAGCSDPTGPETAPTPEDSIADVQPLPADWTIEALMPASVDPTPGGNVQGIPKCQGTQTCHDYDLHLDRTANATAILRWDSPASDLDVYFLDPAGQVIPPADNNGGLGGPEAHRALLEAGDYQIRVQGYLSTASPGTPGTTYVLSVFFDEP
jgi:hypothetical protein